MKGLLILPALCAGVWAQKPEFVPVPEQGGLQMMRTETTVAQFREFVRATGHRTDAEMAGDRRHWLAPGFPLSNCQPVVYVSLRDAEACCSWLGARLPTEAEWAAAARAGAPTRFHFGDQLDPRYVWYRENSAGRPHAVATKRANAWGLHDMEGNVWEWTLRDLESKPGTPGRGVMRGGSWMSCPQISPWAREGTPLTRVPVNTRLEMRDDDVGFRCARPAARSELD
jgi:formylglycine-generating enzyme required for sulfatase activity